MYVYAGQNDHILYVVCPYNTSRLIDTGDVASYTAMDSLGGTEFIDVINIGPDNTHTDWGSNDIPNEGTLTLNKVFVIYQLTTRGEFVLDDLYISKFSLQYSESDSGNYTQYPMVIII